MTNWKTSKYQILALREFENDHIFDEGSCLSVIIGDQEVSGAADVKRLVVRHVAVLRIKKWLFKDALCVLYGEAAAVLKQEAVEAGVFYFGDPGQHRRDRRTRKEYTDHKYHTWLNTQTSGTNSKFYWKNTLQSWSSSVY